LFPFCFTWSRNISFCFAQLMILSNSLLGIILKKQGEFLTKHGLGNITANQHSQWPINVSPQNPDMNPAINIEAKKIWQ
jgi:hypothetical protein